MSVETNALARCPNCAAKLDGATAVDDASRQQPREGDFSICLYCRAALVFRADLTLRPATVLETREAFKELQKTFMSQPRAIQ